MAVGEQMKILVADDEEGARELFFTILSDEGHTITLANDGAEALALFGGNTFDLVITDIKMPVMDGITAAKMIRQLQPEKGPRIIAITAFALEGDREKCIEAGMDDYISKPVKIGELADVLGKYQNFQGSK
jgi:two-component system sensor histidine kinase/response regulator